MKNPPALTAGSDTAALMRERLAALEPEVVEIYDESGEHVGHAGAQSGGGHYQLHHRVAAVRRASRGSPGTAWSTRLWAT